MNYNFTDRVRIILSMAREEAIDRCHDCVAPEHVLIGLIREGEGVGAEVLRELGVDLELLITTLDQRVPRGRSEAVAGELPYTTTAKKMLERAMAESRALNHSYTGSEHLLLGILQDSRRLPASLLADQGVGVDEARAKVLELLGTDLPFDPKQAGPPWGFVGALDGMTEFEKALQFALPAHLGQTDKAGAPYILHPLRLALSLQSEAEQVTALLHDVIEDSGTTLEDLAEAGFSAEVVEAVRCLTKLDGAPDGPGSDYLRGIAANPLARAVKLADLRDNMDLSRLGEVSEADLPRLRKYVASFRYLMEGERSE